MNQGHPAVMLHLRHTELTMIISFRLVTNMEHIDPLFYTW